MNASATLDGARAAGGPGLAETEKQLADIFDLDPKEFAERLSSAIGTERGSAQEHANANSTGQAVSESSPTFTTERLEQSEPGSFERDFWEEVSSFEEQLISSGAKGEVAQTAIAMAAAQFSLEQSGDPGAGQSESGQGQGNASASQAASPAALAGAEVAHAAPAALPTDGAAALVASKMQLENRAQRAVSVSQSLKGSALRAAVGGKG